MSDMNAKKESCKITILMPCRDQKKEFLIEAIGSVLNQTSSNWKLSVIIGPDTPYTTKEIIDSYSENSRIETVMSENPSLAAVLNTGMRCAESEFVSILLSDDRLDKKAVSILEKYIKKYPNVDFFHSSRRDIDAGGKIKTKIMRSKETFTIDYFKKYGSPVKHLLCWRRKKALAVGGMDEELTLHGCDDYFFPWKMAGSGCCFKAIKECLYYYRVHHDFHRLTTHVPVKEQVETIKKGFKKHDVSEAETNEYIKKALKTYIIKDKVLCYEKEKNCIITASTFREASSDKIDEFLNKGFKRRQFFPHRTYCVAKAGPDGLMMARQMCKENNPNKLWEVILYAQGEMLDKFPKELFFDDDLIWHQQQFGKAAQVATANLVKKGRDLYGMMYLSDLVQRKSRIREYKAKINDRFAGWVHMLLNSIMNFAYENNIEVFYSPSADLAIKNTDPSRVVKRELFDRVYDRTILKRFKVTKKGQWWAIDIRKNIDKIAILEKKDEISELGKTICLCHDIERGLGHKGINPDFANSVDKSSQKALDIMLAIEEKAGLKATYNVLGSFFHDVRQKIEEKGHCIAFHSYDHGFRGQLSRCRKVDYRIKGYRPPRSKITWELQDRNLCYHNFEWLASLSNSLKSKCPKIENRIVKIPILFDDFDMHSKKIKYKEWEQLAIDMIKQNYFVAFCLHDCYSNYWLPHYEEFLEKIKNLGTFKTLDEVSAEIILGSAS